MTDLRKPILPTSRGPITDIRRPYYRHPEAHLSDIRRPYNRIIDLWIVPSPPT